MGNHKDIRATTRVTPTPLGLSPSFGFGDRLDMLPKDGDLPSLLDDFHAREVLHVTFGSALAQFGGEIKSSLLRHSNAYRAGLERHFRNHLELLEQRPP